MNYDEEKILLAWRDALILLDNVWVDVLCPRDANDRLVTNNKVDKIKYITLKKKMRGVTNTS
jgi:hypothetical protein